MDIYTLKETFKYISSYLLPNTAENPSGKDDIYCLLEGKNIPASLLVFRFLSEVVYTTICRLKKEGSSDLAVQIYSTVYGQFYIRA